MKVTKKVGQGKGNEGTQSEHKAAAIAGDAEEASEEFIAKAEIVGEELKETYNRISNRLSK